MKSRVHLVAVAAIVLGIVSILPKLAAAQAVQLPTFNYFGVDTTVLVPDGGSVYMGGVNRSASGRVSRGVPGLGGRPFRNTATGRSTSGGGVWVSAQIHDMEAMDRAILGYDANAPRSARSWTIVPKEPSFNDSIVAVRAQAASQDAARQEEAELYLERAREKVREGSPGLAKIYFQMAVRRATGDLRQEALAELRAVDDLPAVAEAKR